MAAVAVIVVEFSAGSLLRVEAEFRIGFAALDIAAGERQQREHDHEDAEAGGSAVQGVHEDRGVRCKTGGRFRIMQGRIIRKPWALWSNAFTSPPPRPTECAFWSIVCGRAV